MRRPRWNRRLTVSSIAAVSIAVFVTAGLMIALRTSVADTPSEGSIRIVENRFKSQTRTQISNDQGAALREEARAELEAELGMPPTQAQIDERFRQKLDALVKEAFDAYKESAQYEQDIEAAVDSILRLDMAPNEYGLLQRRGILKVTGYDLIERHNRWYPVESRLPMDPRRGDFVLVNGRDYRLRPLDAGWILARYPTALGDGAAAA